MMIIWLYLVVVVSSLHGNTQGEGIPSLLPGGPVSGWVGSSVILPVQVSPPISVIQYEVQWSRLNQLDESFIVIHFEDHQNLFFSMKDYNGRARLVGNPYKGDVSMQLLNLTLEDNGKYMCSVEFPEKWKTNTTISLTVEAKGSTPVLSCSDAAESELVNVTCESDGWYPEPIVMWTNNKGEVLQEKSSVLRGNTSLINVSSWVLVSPSESDWVSCSVGISDHNRRESRIRPHTHTDLQNGSAWMLAFYALLVLLLVGIVVLLILCKKGIVQIPGLLKATQVVVSDEGTHLEDRQTERTGLCQPQSLPRAIHEKRIRPKAFVCQYSSI